MRPKKPETKPEAFRRGAVEHKGGFIGFRMKPRLTKWANDCNTVERAYLDGCWYGRVVLAPAAEDAIDPND